MMKELKETALRNQIEENTRIPGPIEGETKALYFNAADVFAFPSISESFGIVLLEAAAAGIPSVSSNLEAFRFFIEDSNFNKLSLGPGGQSP